MSEAAVESVASPPAVEPQEDRAPEAQVPSESVSEGNPDVFTARVREDPDFAVEQVKNAQREVSRMKTKLGPVEQLVDAVGGPDVLEGALRRFNAILNNPAMARMIQEYEQTGNVPTAGRVAAEASDDDADDYEEPWDKSVRPVAQELQSLKGELSKLRGERGVEKVQGFFREFRDEFPLGGDEWQEFTTAMAKQARDWANSEQGLSVIDGMTYQTFRSLGLAKLSKEQMKAAFDREAQQRSEAKAASATDGPSGIGTTGRESPAEFQSAHDAFLEACKREGISADSFHRIVQR
jgi:hypothetical protein